MRAAAKAATAIVIATNGAVLPSEGGTIPNGAHHARTWTNNQPGADLTVVDGRAAIIVPPKGLVCLAIDGAVCTTEIQEAMLDPAAAPLPAGSTTTVRTAAADITATALRFGRGLTSVHVWLKAGPANVQRARLSWTNGGQTRHADCAEFPFEFTVPVADAEAVFRGEVTIWAAGGKALPPVALAVPLSVR